MAAWIAGRVMRIGQIWVSDLINSHFPIFKSHPRGDAQMQRLLPLLISTVLLGAQAPPDITAYVGILPASRTAAITAIKQYRDASRKDDGFQLIEFFEQAGRPAHFCIIETWANSRDLDTHAASANAKDFRNKIDSMRLSDY
jgi:quinol monooxygenase YgiN